MANIDGEMLDDDDPGDGAAIVTVTALEAIARSEVAMQVETAHRYPRSVTKFLREAASIACYSEEIAAACMYSLPRGGKMITGKSIRLAEICASTWGNLHVAARVLEPDAENANAQAVVWDLQRNVRFTVDAKRGILRSNGDRYDADMIRVTGMAAQSVALRNAVFRTIPGLYTDQIFAQARAVAIGDAETLVARRDKWLDRLALMGVTPDRLLARLELHGVADITLDHLATLIGIAQSIKSGDLAVDVAFPPVVTPGKASSPAAPATAAAPEPAPDGRRIKVATGGKRGAPAPASPAKPPAAAPESKSSAAAPSPPTPAATAAPATAAPAPEASTAVDVAALLAGLRRVDDTWSAAADAADIVARWSESERREAYTWVRAILDDRPMAEQMNRPRFTNIDGPEEG